MDQALRDSNLWELLDPLTADPFNYSIPEGLTTQSEISFPLSPAWETGFSDNIDSLTSAIESAYENIKEEAIALIPSISDFDLEPIEYDIFLNI